MKNLFETMLDGGGMTITRAYSVINPGLLSNFSGHRSVLSARIDKDPSLFSKSDWKDADRADLRAVTLETFQARVTACPWYDKGEHVPIIPLVHGTDSTISMKIAENGFTTLSSLDAGFYGSGIYFLRQVRTSLLQ